MSEKTPSLFPGSEKDPPLTHTTGILPDQQIEEMIREQQILAKTKIEPGQIQPASMDLRLGRIAYRVRASFLPGKETTVDTRVKDLKMHEIDLSKPAVLEKGCVYIVPLKEELRLPAQISGRVNPKSTTGRLDVFTRLITDYGPEFETVGAGYSGPLFVEVVPRAFSVLVHEGTRLNQIRFTRGEPRPSVKKLKELAETETLSYLEDDSPGEAVIHRKGLWISIDLEGKNGSEIIGYKAKPHTPLIDLDKVNCYDPLDFWDPIRRPGLRNLILNPGDFYILTSKQKVRVPAQISGRVNPKSTTGRLDVFTRLITDYGPEFETVGAGYSGPLFVEVVPRAFSVLVHEGTRLNQIRFTRGEPRPSVKKLKELAETETLSYLEDDSPGEAVIHRKGLWISIDLEGKNGSEIIGYKAKPHTPLIDLDKVNCYDPLDFWDPIRRPGLRNLILNPGDFYILTSKQKVRVPAQYAAEMVAYDPSVGEFRIHYAGFFDPGFGYGNDDIKGTHAVLEVRSHEVPFLLEDGQMVGRLIYERLLGRPQKIYGTGIGSSYQKQGLSLSKQFRR